MPNNEKPFFMGFIYGYEVQSKLNDEYKAGWIIKDRSVEIEMSSQNQGGFFFCVLVHVDEG